MANRTIGQHREDRILAALEASRFGALTVAALVAQTGNDLSAGQVVAALKRLQARNAVHHQTHSHGHPMDQPWWSLDPVR